MTLTTGNIVGIMCGVSFFLGTVWGRFLERRRKRR